MDFLLFDQNAIEILAQKSMFQSIEFSQGKRFIEHICGNVQSETIEGIRIEHTDAGILFVGKSLTVEMSMPAKIRFFCIDLTQCEFMSEQDSPTSLLIVLQKAFRTVIRIWENRPFTQSERIHGSKSIIFPFAFGDRRRIVIERKNEVSRFQTRGIEFPLLAYKYNAEDAPNAEETANIIARIGFSASIVSSKHIGKRLI